MMPLDDDDAPELTAERAAKLRPAHEVLPPEVIAAFKRPGRPRVAAPKQVVSIRLDPEVLAWFKATGPGWQTRIQEILAREAGKA